MLFEVEVTQKDIDEGQASERAKEYPRSSHCAVARAVSRVLGKPCHWFYTTGSSDTVVAVGHMKIDFRAVQAKVVDAFVAAHDNLDEVKPFTFLLTRDKE